MTWLGCWVLAGVVTAGAAETEPASSEASSPTEQAAPPEVRPVLPAEPRQGPPVAFEFGKGVTFRSRDDQASLTMRGRVQVLLEVEHDAADLEAPTDVIFMIRRARLNFGGKFLGGKLAYYVELGLSPKDLETDLPVPLLDANVTWVALRDLELKAGQMKVPFNRERVVSSSALQLVDRSIVNSELNLDRDVGFTLFSNDVGGLGERLGYQLGVFGGEGRNRWGDGTGLLYVARLEVRPLGEFEDAYVESDLSRDRRPRLALGGGFAYDDEAYRERSTTGSFYELGTRDSMHAEADLIFKAAGFSLMSEFLWRRVDPASREGTVDDVLVEEPGRSGWGWFAQAGYLFPFGFEIAARWAELHPLVDVPTALELEREGTVGLNWYVKGHNLKLQGDYSFTYGEDFGALAHRGRLSTQVYF